MCCLAVRGNLILKGAYPTLRQNYFSAFFRARIALSASAALSNAR